MAQAQRVEWFLSSKAFEDAADIYLMKNTIEIYNEVRGKVLQHRLDFSIGELAFIEGEEIYEQGKSLASVFDATVRLKWSLDGERAPLFPPIVLEEGEELSHNFADWVFAMPKPEEGRETSLPSVPPMVQVDDPFEWPTLVAAPVAPASLVDLTGNQD